MDRSSLPKKMCIRDSKKIVAVNDEGLIKGMKAGTARITIGTHNGLSKTLTVKVYDAPKKVYLKPSTLSLGEEMTAELSVSFPKSTYSLYSFEVSDPTVVSVGADGSLKALKPGEATVTAVTLNGKRASCTVKVYAAPENIGVAEQKVVRCV